MSTPKAKVAIISNSFASTFVFRGSLVRKLSERDALSCIVSLNDDIHRAVSQINPKYLFTVRKGLIHLILDTFRLALRLRREKATSIHGFTHLGNLLASIVSLIVPCDLVLTVTGMGRAFSSDRWINLPPRMAILFFYFFTQFFASTIIVQNTADARLFKKILMPKNRHKILRTNGSGIDLNYYSGVRLTHGDGSSIKVGFFSRALPEKGVEAFYNLAVGFTHSVNLEFHHWGLPGVGNFEADKIKKYAAQNNVTYYGYAPDAREYVAGVDIIVIPSAYREGMSRLCIEAMLAGKIVVAHRTTGVEDHLIDGVNGFLYAGDKYLRSALEQAIECDWSTVGANAQDYAKSNFSAEAVDAVYFNAYRITGEI